MAGAGSGRGCDAAIGGLRSRSAGDISRRHRRWGVKVAVRMQAELDDSTHRSAYG